MNPFEWLLSLTDHQLNVLGTAFAMIASSAAVLGVVSANYARLARRDARAAKEQTTTVIRQGGVYKERSIAKTGEVLLAQVQGHEDRDEIIRQEFIHALEQLVPCGNGRYRHTTNTVRLPVSESHYKSEEDQEEPQDE